MSDVLSRGRDLLESHGPTSPMFRRRIAIVGGAISIGLVALAFAAASDRAGEWFAGWEPRWRWATLLTTPLGFAAIVWLTRRFAPAARGSGIPQVIAAKEALERSREDGSPPPTGLVTMWVAGVKAVLTVGALGLGASVGREGPTVQLAAALMAWWHRRMGVAMRASVYVAGGAAGVAAAFNTPLAGIAFAIEELAAAYEQRMALLVMTAILIAGAVASGLAGDYVYFGLVNASLPIAGAVLVAPVAGVVGGLAGGLFSLLVQGAANARVGWVERIKARPVLFAAGCGLATAVLGLSTGLTWGTGYAPARAIIDGSHPNLWFGPAKFLSTLASAVAGIPGGIFAPSLSTGAGIGNLLRPLFPSEPATAVVLLGMVAYFAGVVRAPLTAVFILSETTASRGLLLPMFAAALVADQVSTLVCREKLYHGLSRGFLPVAGGAVLPREGKDC